MGTNNEIKLKKLLDLHVQGTIMLASWLDANGFSHELQQRYRKSGWLESVEVGAFKRPNEVVGWQGALYSVQEQANLTVHIGGPTALSMLGFSHYIRTGAETVYLFSLLNARLPAWFKQYSWNEAVNHVKTSFLSEEIGVAEYQETQFQLMIASAERAIFECLYLTPEKITIETTIQTSKISYSLLLARKKAVVLVENVICFDIENSSFPEL
ncbi:MAG: type IV toxin-antitoxin system AbiEi family antitoxin [Prolixibacteraceae bacterium]|nr:type IV toxin-antitoxin system AbiEi family antitoxin [Prolixibacteraceae bacterium]